MEKSTATLYKDLQGMIGPVAAAWLDTMISLALYKARAHSSASIARKQPAEGASWGAIRESLREGALQRLQHTSQAPLALPERPSQRPQRLTAGPQQPERPSQHPQRLTAGPQQPERPSQRPQHLTAGPQQPERPAKHTQPPQRRSQRLSSTPSAS